MNMDEATLTRRELINMLEALEGSDDHTPVVGYIDTVDNYTNLVDVYFDPDGAGPAIVLELRDNFDTRQF